MKSMKVPRPVDETLMEQSAQESRDRRKKK